MRAAYAKFGRAASGYAMTGVFLAEFKDGLRVTVTGAGPGVFRWTAAEEGLRKGLGAQAFAQCDIDESLLNADLHAPAAYRAQLMRVMGARALQHLSTESPR